jgi:hypothetical protein
MKAPAMADLANADGMACSPLIEETESEKRKTLNEG